MGKAKIPKVQNLYKETDVIDLFREVFAMEKIHGTATSLEFKDGKIIFHSGGETHVNFVALFDQEALLKGFQALGCHEVTVYGEGYGGKQQRMSATYGPSLKFVAFDVKIGDNWLSVPKAEKVVTELGLEFVHYARGPATLEFVDAQRDAPSEQAKRNGIPGDKRREGVMLRPMIELTKNNGDRIMAKHKRKEFMETATPRKVDPAQLAVLKEANAIAEEWVTDMRLEHVLDKLQPDGKKLDFKDTGTVIKAMVEDIQIEGKGEIVWSKDASRAIGKRARMLFHKGLTKVVTDG
jgi:hypothetical protein